MHYFLVALVFSLSLSPFAKAEVPTFKLHCETESGVEAQAKIDLNATRLSNPALAKGEITSLELNANRASLSLAQAIDLSGQIEDGRSHLVIHLEPSAPLYFKNHPSLMALEIDLSYEDSVSHLLLSDGTSFVLQCKVLP